MKHVKRVSKQTPAMAAQADVLTNWGKATPGILGMNEIGDVPLWLAGIINGLSGLYTILPTGVAKSGA